MNGEITKITVPRVGTNDEHATLAEWCVNDNAQVMTGDIVCAMETTKSVFEVETPIDGYIIHLMPAGREVAIGQPVALVCPSRDAIKSHRERMALATQTAERPRATRKAEALAKEMGIDLSEVPAVEIIREDDIRNLACGRGMQIQKSHVEPPNPDEVGYVDPQFVAAIKADHAFAQLSSPLKIKLYRDYGAKIEDGVHIGLGSIILSNVIRLGRDAQIKDECSIKATRFALGRMSVIGLHAQIATREVIIGDVCFSGENIIIGGGGAWGPNSSLHTGDNCLMSSRCLINTAEPVTIGNEVGLSPNVQLYTHNHWQNTLQGFMARHAPIRIEDGAYITGNCLVAPGAHIGAYATVLANSVVSGNVPTRAIVSGVPAKVVGHNKDNLSLDEQERAVLRFMPRLSSLLAFHNLDADSVIYSRSFDYDRRGEERIVLTFEPLNLPRNLEELVVFDLKRLEVEGEQTRTSDEVRNFLRRQGIRFRPIYWRYTHDENLFVQ